jgi:hemolysin activation/secretion protein
VVRRAERSLEAAIKKNFLRRRPLPLLRAAVASLCCAASASAWCETAAATVAVDAFEVSGNTLLPAERLDAALAPYKGRRTLEELKEAAAAVQELYRQAGYGAVVAYLPEQMVTGGKVAISVLEGKVGSVVVIGNEQFSTEAIRRTVPALQEGRTPHVRNLDMQVRLANENPAHQLAVTLEPGASQGEVDARIGVTERKVSRWWLYVDNTGDDQTGDWRVTVGWRHDNVAGLDHQTTLQLQTSPTDPSDVIIGTATYSVPFYSVGMRLDAYAAYSTVDSGTTPSAAGSLRFNGEGGVLGARLTKLLPRVGEIDQRLSVALDRRDYLNECEIAGLPDGACGPAGESVTANPLTLEYSMQSGGAWPAGLYLAWSNNLDLGGRYGDQSDFDAVRPGAPLHYSAWRLGGSLSIPVLGDWGLRARVLGQATEDALVPGEQFGLAGARAVRGYYEREVIGDQGYLGSLELVTPDLLARTTMRSAGSLYLSAFGDAGVADNHLGTECRQGQTRCTLVSYGVGLGWARGAAQLKLDVARADRDGNTTEKGDWRAHVTASYAFE